MHIWTQPDHVPADWPACVVTIGVFDGVHRGHRELIRTAVNQAKAANMPVVVLTFDPNPVEIVSRSVIPSRLSTLQQRLHLIEELGVDAVYVLPFTSEVAQQTPQQFAGSVLSDLLHAGHVVIGANFRFGHRARGTIETLTDLGQTLGFEVTTKYLVPAHEDETPVSSTLIRELIATGDMPGAAAQLVRPHRVEGMVVTGDGRGRELGFPTANLEVEPLTAIPPDGVYAGRLVIDPYGEPTFHHAAISIGTNPTFEGVEGRRVEAWAYGRDDLQLYDTHIAVDLVARIRGQEQFSSVEQLQRAVKQDEQQARLLLGDSPR